MKTVQESTIQHLWYTRRGEQITGPYPLKQVKRFIILGRINEKDELSMDRVNWKPLSELPDLIPSILKNPDSPDGEARLTSARLKEDERQYGDRRLRHLDELDSDRRIKDRRRPESATILEYRKFKTDLTKDRVDQKKTRKSEYFFAGLAVGLMLLGGAALLLIVPQSAQPPAVILKRDCAGLPSPGIDWSNCQLQGAQLFNQNLSNAKLRSTILVGANLSEVNLNGADLSYADLSIAQLRGAQFNGALMIGATLKKADLENTDLTGADLSYANLGQANIQGAKLGNVKLDNAVWIDETICAPGSRGQCLHR